MLHKSSFIIIDYEAGAGGSRRKDLIHQSNITQESLLSWRSPLRSAKFMLAGLIPHRNQWAKRKEGEQRLPSSRTIVIALDNLELYFLEKVKWETYNFQEKQIKVKDYIIFSVFKRFHVTLNTQYFVWF